MLDGRFLSDAMAPDDLFDYEVRGAVVRGMVPLMRESGYRAEAIEISNLTAIRSGNRFMDVGKAKLMDRFHRSNANRLMRVRAVWRTIAATRLGD